MTNAEKTEAGFKIEKYEIIRSIEEGQNEKH